MAAMSRGPAVALLLLFCLVQEMNVVSSSPEELPPPLQVSKCCAMDEMMLETEQEGARCAKDNTSTPWAPVFSSEDGLRTNVQLGGAGFRVQAPAFLECGARQQWPIYHYLDSSDRLMLLETGWLRHFVRSRHGERHYDYEPHLFCLDRGKLASGQDIEFAVVCAPEAQYVDPEVRFLLFLVLDPILHAVSMVFLLFTAIVYFIVPQLRDLLGNMVTTLSLSLLTVYAADMVRLFRGFSEHVSFLAADIVLHVSLLATFFWLNSMGYYIWRTFRSRNVFLRVTDKRKYCYYSCYAWGSTLTMAAFALFCHFVMDVDPKRSHIPASQRSLGFLGMAMFFTPIAFTVLVNIFFYLTTGQAISRMSTYGRIHHKMKFNFEMFLKLFLVLGTTWICMLISGLKHTAVAYFQLVALGLQGPLVFYICVCQRRVLFLLRKSFCSDTCISPCCRPPTNSQGEEGDWGEEMMNMTPQY